MQPDGANVMVTALKQNTYYTPANFLNSVGVAYSTVSVSAAINGFLTSMPLVTGGGGGGSGTVPAWIPNLDPGYQTAPQVQSAIAAATGPLSNSLTGKVDKVNGFGLSSNDYTPAEKNKLAGIASGATSTTLANNLATTTPGMALDAAQGKVLKDAIDLNSGAINTKQTNLTLTTTGTGAASLTPQGVLNIPTPSGAGGSTTILQAATTTGIALARTGAGFVIPQFRTTDRFDYDGAALPANQLAIHSSGIGLVSSTSGVFSDGYIKLGTEILPQNRTRTDGRVIWDCNEVGASTTFILGPAANGYAVTIANSGTNVVTTMPSGATTAAPLSGTVVFGVSFATVNMGITSSVSILGATPPTLATTNPYRSPIYEWNLCTKQNLWSLYIRTNAVSCKVEGALFNPGNWNGDPTGQLLTRSVVLHSVGAIGQYNAAGVSTQPRDHDTRDTQPVCPCASCAFLAWAYPKG